MSDEQTLSSRIRSAREVTLVEVIVREGDGDEARDVTYFYTTLGYQIAKRDPSPDVWKGGVKQ